MDMLLILIVLAVLAVPLLLFAGGLTVSSLRQTVTELGARVAALEHAQAAAAEPAAPAPEPEGWP